jgi:hypothetical protein
MNLPSQTKRFLAWSALHGNILALSLASAGTLAQQATAGQSQPARNQARPPKLSHEATGEPVVDLLRDLSAKAGSRWTADAEIGERRTHVLLKEVPETRLRTAVADVVDGIWKERGSGDRILQADPHAAAEAERMLAKRRQEFFDRLRALIRNAGQDPGPSAPGSELQGAIGGANRAAAQLAGLLGDQQWQQLADTGQLSLLREQLGDRGVALMGNYIQQLNEFQLQTGSPPLDPEEAAQGPFRFQIMPDANGEPYGGLQIMVQTRMAGGGMLIGGSRPANGPPTRWTDGRPTRNDGNSREPTMTVNFDQPPANWGVALRAVAQDLKLSIVSEDYTHRPGFASMLRGQVTGTVPEILDRLCRTFGYQWRVRNGIYEFRSAAWYVDRKLEPPGTLVKIAVVAREEKQPLGLEWMARTAALTADQQMRLRTYAFAGVDTAQRFRPVLLFFNVLSSGERAALERETGLKPDRLQPRQREALVAALQPLAPDWQLRDAAQARASLKQDLNTARFSFTLNGRTVEAAIPLPTAGPRTMGGGGFGSPPPPARPPGQ